MLKVKTINENMNRKIIFLFLLIFYFEIIGINAQSITTTAGGTSTGSAGTVSYTIGQVFYSSSISPYIKITEGVQQAYEITIITGIKEAGEISLNITAFPNPTTNYITLKLDKYVITNLLYTLYDISGKQFLSEKIINKETIIKLENLPASTYFLKLTDNNKEIKIFKIIKTH